MKWDEPSRSTVTIGLQMEPSKDADPQLRHSQCVRLHTREKAADVTSCCCIPESVTSSSIMADTKRLALSIIQFLQQQQQAGGLSSGAQESLEGESRRGGTGSGAVATSCDWRRAAFLSV